MSVTDSDDLEATDSQRSDVELIAAVRTGDMTAYGELWSRHEAAARRFATSIARPGDVEELVSESFFRVLRAINHGGGPNAAFRGYLFQAMRNANVDVGRGYLNRVVLTDEDRLLDIEQASSAAEVSAEQQERTAAVQAWASLPESSRTLLWHLIIEEETPAQVAPLLGISPNGVSSRAVRAKERLRQAFLQQQLNRAADEACAAVRGKFGAYVRGALPDTGREQVREHLATCVHGCPEALAEISDLNATLRAVVAPAILGGPLIATHYVPGAAHAAVAAASGGGVLGSVRRLTHHLPGTKVLSGAAAAALLAGGVLLALRAMPSSRDSAGAPVRTISPAQPVSSPSATSGVPQGTSQAPTRGQLPPAGSKGPARSAPAGPTGHPSSTGPAASAPSTSPSTPPRTSAGTPATVSAPATLPTSLSTMPIVRRVTFTVLPGTPGGTLTASVPSGWKLISVSSASRGRCRLAVTSAVCSLPAAGAGSLPVTFAVRAPSPSASGVMTIRYGDSPVQSLPI